MALVPRFDKRPAALLASSLASRGHCPQDPGIQSIPLFHSLETPEPEVELSLKLSPELPTLSASSADHPARSSPWPG